MHFKLLKWWSRVLHILPQYFFKNHARSLPFVGLRPPPSKAVPSQLALSADEVCCPETAGCLCATSFSLSRTFCTASCKLLVITEVALAQRQPAASLRELDFWELPVSLRSQCSLREVVPLTLRWSYKNQNGSPSEWHHLHNTIS